MPRRGHRRTKNDQLSVPRRECLTTRRKYTRSKGDALLHEAWKTAKTALKQDIKKSWFQCLKNLIVEVTKKLETRRKTPSQDNLNRVKYIVQSFFPQVESFQRQNRSSCVVRCEELFTFKELKRAGGMLRANTAAESTGCQARSSKKWSRYTRRSFWKPLTPVFGKDDSLMNGRGRGCSFSERERNLWRMAHPINRYVYWIQWENFWRKWSYNDYRVTWLARTVSRRTSSAFGKAGPQWTQNGSSSYLSLQWWERRISMGARIAATGRACKNRIRTCTCGRASQADRAATTVGKTFLCSSSWCGASIRLNERLGAGEGLERTDDGRVVHDLKPEPAAREVWSRKAVPQAAIWLI